MSVAHSAVEPADVPEGFSPIDYLTDHDDGSLSATCDDCESQVVVINMYGRQYLVQVDDPDDGAYDYMTTSVAKKGRREAYDTALRAAENIMQIHRRLRHE